MEVLGIILIMAVAIVVGILFFYIFKYTGPWGRLWTFIIILVLAGLSAGAWVEPVGPQYQNVAWFPVIFVILLFALFLAAATPPPAGNRNIATRNAEIESEREEMPQVALSAFFWLFLMFMLFVAAWGLML